MKKLNEWESEVDFNYKTLIAVAAALAFYCLGAWALYQTPVAHCSGWIWPWNQPPTQQEK